MPLEDVFAKRSAWRVLSALLEPPFVAHAPSAIARTGNLTKISVQRGLRALTAGNLARRTAGGYRANVELDAVRYLWLLLQTERLAQFPATLRNALAQLDPAVGHDFGISDRACIVVFGSWARGVAVVGESDVDVAIFDDPPETLDRELLEANVRFGVARRGWQMPRLEFHPVPLGELDQPRRTVSYAALVNGIPVTNARRMFDALLRLHVLPTNVLIERVQHARSFLAKRDAVAGDEAAQHYYTEAAERTAWQVDNILRSSRTRSWREGAHDRPIDELIDDLEARLAAEGAQLWIA